MSYALTNWALDARTSVRSALPVDILDGAILGNASSGATANYHPDRVPGAPLYLTGSQYLGGSAINYNGFVATSGGGAVDGNADRNSARGFDAVQQDLTLRRDFPFTEKIGLQFRVEAYNILNRPVFGDIYNELSSGANLFGQTYDTQSSDSAACQASIR